MDILILQCAGNLYDTISLAIKCALYNLRIPRVSSALLDGGNVDLVLSDDPEDCDKLNIDSVPILVTLCKIGNHCIVDPSVEEEICSTANVVVGVSGDKVTSMKSITGGSLHPDTMDECIDLAVGTAKQLNSELMKALIKDEKLSHTSKGNKCSFLN